MAEQNPEEILKEIHSLLDDFIFKSYEDGEGTAVIIKGDGEGGTDIEFIPFDNEDEIIVKEVDDE